MEIPLPRDVARFIGRELRTLGRELEAYPSDDLVWALPPGAPNSAGTLTLHLCGNLQHYIGAHLGRRDYVRNRDAEFSARGVSRTVLLAELSAAADTVEQVLSALPATAMAEVFPEPIRGEVLSTQTVLLQLAVHLAYHLGQASYHRRLVTGDTRGVDALSPADLHP